VSVVRAFKLDLQVLCAVW